VWERGTCALAHAEGVGQRERPGLRRENPGAARYLRFLGFRPGGGRLRCCLAFVLRLDASIGLVHYQQQSLRHSFRWCLPTGRIWQGVQLPGNAIRVVEGDVPGAGERVIRDSMVAYTSSVQLLFELVERLGIGHSKREVIEANSERMESILRTGL
jgi:hypothetical protein